ncbi:GGDEF domain-containing protein [Microvirga lotononidis]|uniref:diguanylate cyclase n=1 Tax=Microvirga lotononidis TaxID=864069 RepID=I4YX38_9HYPH|nr:GGDEF domain-containing protein [Microvirga lotononidis]EIM28530.1 diguanylate cyclase (GGDEF) domain-containing protein [Microvirga lotononidis]WQO27399.1 GGDEF domain-containing protein [Microvirga lotononidis]
MVLDPATLTVAFVLLSAALGTLLLFSWALNPRVKALAWWGGAYWLIALGIGSANIRPGPPAYSLLLVANTLGLLCYGALYTGCRVFNGRSAPLAATLGAAAIWLGAFPFIYTSQSQRLLLIASLTLVYSILAAWELGRHASRSLTSSRVVLVLLLGLAAFNLSRIGLALAPTSVSWIDALAHRWSPSMALLLVVFGPSLAFMFLSMAKESVELEYKQAALVDPLTGVPNRRAFMQNASRLLARLGSKPVSCLLFDLDNFKAINDRHGHDTGDRILRIFGEVLTSHLPQGTFGRLGGEEFGAILPLAAREAAVLAEGVRHAFSTAGAETLGDLARVTVSVGCVTGAGADAGALLRRADAALYQAKRSGRNIVIAA